MHGFRDSDSLIVPKKLANKTAMQNAAAESMKGKGLDERKMISKHDLDTEPANHENCVYYLRSILEATVIA